MGDHYFCLFSVLTSHLVKKWKIKFMSDSCLKADCVHLRRRQGFCWLIRSVSTSGCLQIFAVSHFSITTAGTVGIQVSTCSNRSACWHCSSTKSVGWINAGLLTLFQTNKSENSFTQDSLSFQGGKYFKGSFQVRFTSLLWFKKTKLLKAL